MSKGLRNVRDYLEELERTKGERDPQVREGLEAYVDLWKKAMEKGVVSAEDAVDDALGKLEKAGGLYKATEG
ncbi:MAG: hypothetical protein JRM80_12550 [Nitrososphaerota archaeon]|nr:hypothetical protein [Nitrososphaerota archaeon]